MSVARKLDVIVPSYNRPARLYALLRSGLAMDVPGLHLVVIDDGSDAIEPIPGAVPMDTRAVCESFADPRIVYIRNETNVGVAESWVRYYRDHCRADYTLSVTDKDEFVDPAPIRSALAKLDADPGIAMVVIPLRQKDRDTEDRLIAFAHTRMTGRNFLRAYVRDNALQHCSMWGVMRVAAARAAGLPRPMGLRGFGLDDGFGIDLDFVFAMAAQGDVDFETTPHVRRSTIGGGTERYPLTFAYTYYQYAKRILRELDRAGFIDRESAKVYRAFWILLICRGLRVAFRPVHGSEQEPGTARIAGHLRMPIHLYLALECLRAGVWPAAETRALFAATGQLMLADRLARLRRHLRAGA